MALLTAGDPNRVTGGYLFHRRMADAAVRFGAEVEFVSIPAWPLPWALAAGPWWLRSPALGGSDVVVLDSIAAAPAAPWLSRLRAPILGMLHQPPGGIDGGQLVRRVGAPFDRWAYHRAELLMVASGWLAEQLAGAGIARSRMRVVPPGKDPVRSAMSGSGTETAAATEEALDLRAGRRVAALCVATWLPNKGIIELLEAVAQLPDDRLTLHLVGDTTAGRYAQRIRRRLGRADLVHRVRVHGIVPPSTVQRLYHAADLCVLPSFEESYGTVWGEAMAAGLPVVGWRAGNLPFLVDHGREGLMAPPGDVPALSRLLEALATDDERRRAMGEAAAQRAAARPTWDDTAALFFAAIEEVLERRRPKAGT